MYVCELINHINTYFYCSALQNLHGFSGVDAFLRPLFDNHASTWFESYLSEGMLIKAAKRKSDSTLEKTKKGCRNDLDDYLTHREGGGNLTIRYEQENDQWIAVAQIKFDGTEGIERRVSVLNKKTAQNEVCCLLLQEIKERDSADGY